MGHRYADWSRSTYVKIPGLDGVSGNYNEPANVSTSSFSGYPTNCCDNMVDSNIRTYFTSVNREIININIAVGTLKAPLMVLTSLADQLAKRNVE